MSLSQNLKNLRVKKNMTQEQLANILGVSAQAVSKWETSETYPDGALLVPIANALDVSLDILFDNNVYTMKDISMRIGNLLSNTSKEQQFHVAHDICWQIERGLFGARLYLDDMFSLDRVIKNGKSSYILNDYGFTYASNGPSPFFAVFPEYNDKLSEVISDGEEMRKIFAMLSSPDTMKAVLFIHRNEANYVFEADVLAKECAIKSEDVDAVLNDLMSLKLLTKNDIEIDGKSETLYYTRPSHLIIALFLFAHELNYNDGYCVKSVFRNKPFIK